LDAKNPTDTWVAGTFAIAFWLINNMWHLAKYNIGLSTALGGTGMCIATDIVRKYGWGCDCLTEDMEFSMKVLLQGVRTTWAHDAIIYDEKPLGFMQSCRQRKRWAQGQFDCGGRFIPKLFARGIKMGDIRALDGILTLSQPFFLLLSTFLSHHDLHQCVCAVLYEYLVSDSTYTDMDDYRRSPVPHSYCSIDAYQCS
jgi:cellulose synthase/poly-beta-1,6-N-acetylglucosamine synthase-like glycosyltransferase